MKKWKHYLAGFMVSLGLMGAVAAAPTASAINVFGQCSQNGGSAVCGAQGDSAAGIVKNVINTLLVVLGMIAVLMIVIGGIRYTTSAGDSSATKAAKDTVLYSVVGLVIAMLSFAIVNFVVKSF